MTVRSRRAAPVPSAGAGNPFSWRFTTPLFMGSALNPINSLLIATASGLFRTFGYIGSIASSALISITFRTSVTDHGLHVIAVIMIAVSAVTLLMTLADRRLRDPVTQNSAKEEAPMTDPTPAIDARHAALLVMDYQNAIIGRLGDAEALLARVADAIAVFAGACTAAPGRPGSYRNKLESAPS